MNIKRKEKSIFLLPFFVGVFFATVLLVSYQATTANAAGCLTGETCTQVELTNNGTKFLEPTGFTCTSRGGCPNEPYQVCCKKNSAAAPAAATTSTAPVASSRVCGPTEFCNPLAFDDVEGFLGGILSAIQKIIVVLALVFIMIGAVMILTSAGNSGMVEKGKGAITMALVGLALGVAAPSLLKELSAIIGWGPGAAGPGLTLSQIAVNVLNFLLGTMGIVALVMLVIGAILYLTSAGDEDRIEKGKEIFKFSLIGVVLAMSSMILVKQIAQFFQ